MEKLRVQLDENIDRAIDQVCTAEVDYMVMGMSAETFWDGKAGNDAFKRRVKERSGGLDVATGAEACERALHNFGVRTIGVVTPYQPNGDAQVIKFFTELGFDVVKLIGLKRPTAVSIAHTTQDELRGALLELNEEKPDALVQVGTNLSHGRPGRRGRALAAQARHRHQRRHLVDGPARQRHQRHPLRLRPPPRGVLTQRLRRGSHVHRVTPAAFV